MIRGFVAGEKTGKPEPHSGPVLKPVWIASRLSRLFKCGDQRDDPKMLEIPLQFLIELIRAFAVETLSGQLRGRVSMFSSARKIRGTAAVLDHVHKRNRDRLFHRLHTEGPGDL
jgi:hypothetical protein